MFMNRALIAALALAFANVEAQELQKNDVNKAMVSPNAPNTVNSPSIREIFSRDMLNFKFKMFNETLNYSNTTGGIANTELKSSGARELKLNWALTSGVRWRPLISLGLKTQDYSLAPSDGITQTTDNYWNMGIGMEHRLGARWSLKGMMEISQYPYLDYSISSGVISKEVIPVALTQFSLLADVLVWQLKYLVLDTQFGFMFNLDKSKANFTAKRGYGTYAELGLAYWFSRSTYLRAGGWSKGMWQEVRNLDFNSETKRVTNGATLTFGKAF